MPQEPWHPGKDAKLDRVIQLNFREVDTHASYKATRTWENFKNRVIKIILVSDELWSIANNSKSFASGSKSIISNLGLYKRSDIYLIFKNIMDLMVEKYRFGKERYIKQINDICEGQKITMKFGGKRSCLKRIRVYNTWEERGGSRHSFGR